VYSQKYVPNNLSSNQEEFFKQADNSFGYNPNFNQTFSVCFCSACHSKYKHIKKVKSNTTEIKQSESSLYNNNCDSELKFKLFVENKTGNMLPGKIKKNTTIDIPPVYSIFNISYGRIVQLQFPSQSIDSNNILPYGMSYAPQSQIIYYTALVHSTNSFGLS
ncbi:2034_t:CDS:2, partial [Gigaspora rosea]